MKRMFAAIAAAAASFPLLAGIEMGVPFSGGAVLQRGMKVPVWGKTVPAVPGSKIKVEFAGQAKTADVDASSGEWKVELDPMDASKSGRAMKVTELSPGGAAASSEEIRDILVGEVWFASGQSNMECPIWGGNTRYRDGKGALVTSMTRLPCVRFMKSPKKWSAVPYRVTAKWHRFEPDGFAAAEKECGLQLSAVAFYYARELYLALDVPIGVVDASWGGTNIDAWTPRSGYDGCDGSLKAVAEYPVTSNWNAKTCRRGPVGDAHQQPTVLFNGMVSAFAPMAMRGFIWYQGCHNEGESHLYCAKLHALYEGWRREFANPGLKFYLVQLAPYNRNWLGICMAQTKFVSEEKNAALAVAADAGNFFDIHPNDKETVAKRLAVHALKRDYGFDIPQDDSPVLKSVSFKDGKAFLSFGNVKSWYVYSPDRSKNAAFELAGPDGKWAPAKVVNWRTVKRRAPIKAKRGSAPHKEATDFIDGPEIVLSSDAVKNPVKVRYMGQPRTSGTIYNEASLPLGPFEAQ